MKTTTLKQAVKIIDIFKDTPVERTQALLESGLLTDLRDSNIAKIDRGKFLDLINFNGSVTHPSNPDLVFDRRDEGCILVRHTRKKIASVNDIKNLRLLPILEEGERNISLQTMELRIIAANSYHCGQEDAEWLLWHQKNIPSDFRLFDLYFSGTIWEIIGHCIPGIYWSNEQWRFCFHPMNVDVNSYSRIVLLK